MSLEQDLDDQFRSLMEGLRTTLPGVQVLFAFLLILPLQGAFAEISSGERLVYYVAFISAAVATVLLIAPSVHQRLRARATGMRRRHERHVRAAIRLANAGTLVFVASLTSATYLVSTLVYGDVLASVVATGIAGVAGAAWFYLPLVRWQDD